MRRVWGMRGRGKFELALPRSRAQPHRLAGRQLGLLEGLVLVERDPGAGGKGDAIDLPCLVEREIVPCFVDSLADFADYVPAAEGKPGEPDRSHDGGAPFEPCKAAGTASAAGAGRGDAEPHHDRSRHRQCDHQRHAEDKPPREDDADVAHNARLAACEILVIYSADLGDRKQSECRLRGILAQYAASSATGCRAPSAAIAWPQACAAASGNGKDAPKD